MADVTITLNDGESEQVVTLEPEDRQLYFSQIEPQDIYPQTVRKFWTGTCSENNAVSQKNVALDDPTGFTLAYGVVVAVYFEYRNTAHNPTLNVNGTGAKPIWYARYGSTSGSLPATSYYDNWGEGVHFFTYDGGSWILTHTDYTQFDFLNKYKANIHTPTFTGTPKAPTAATGTNTTQIATTAFVQQELEGTRQTLTLTGDGSVTISLTGGAS